MLIKHNSSQINEIVHSLGILLSLPKILEEGEKVESMSLAAANTGKGFDLETSERIAEFTFIEWQGSAVTEDEMFPVPCEAPAFSSVAEITEVFQGLTLEDQALSALPFELVEAVFAQGEALAKESHRELELLEDFPRFWVDLSQGRGAVASGGFVVRALMEKESLGGGARVVRRRLNDFVLQGDRTRNARFIRNFQFGSFIATGD